ncbi:hypothetical protein CBR_g45670 [Chara braunii]|nr:hypothetical protein CBR_g45670 [Chara braunii]|eukprot:GBG64615.1 hypothetical protein CBR_g45670 [Chara braunii]
MDDILVYSKTYHDHAQHIEWTLGALRDAGFKIALEKSEFFLSEISLLGYVVTRGGLRPDSRKVAAVKEAPVPTSLTQRTNVEGDLLGFLFGSVRTGHRQLIVQELAQLADDVPLEIVSQSDESPIPHVLARTLAPFLLWPACLEEQGSSRNPPSQRGYLNLRDIIDLAFFHDRTASENEEIEEEEADEEEAAEEDKEETLEEGSYSEHNEEELSEEGEEEEQDDEEEELELEESEWEISAEEEEPADAQAEDPKAAHKKEEIAAGKRQLEFTSAANLSITDDPTRGPEQPKPEDGEQAETSSAPTRRRRSRSPSPSAPDRPAVRARTDAGHRSSSPVVIPSSP